MTYSCCSINQFARDVRSIGSLLCCTYYQHMIVINSMAESTTLGEIDIHMLPARNEAVDRRKGQGHLLTSPLPSYAFNPAEASLNGLPTCI
jgi:hypothetical protein